MGKYLIVVLFVSSMAVAEASREDPASKERDALQGVWVTASIEERGAPVNADTVKERRLEMTFKGKEFTWQRKSVSSTGTFRIDPTKTPKTLDFDLIVPTKETWTWTAIYELDGDTLRVHLPDVGLARPKDFKTNKDGPTSAVIVFKREKK